MRRIFLSALVLLIATSGMAQIEAAKRVFSSPNLDREKAKMRTVAILPFNVTVSYKKLPKNMTLDMVKDEEEKARPEYQTGMYTYLLRKADKFSVTFQDPNRTNALLKKAGFYKKDELDIVLADSLCAMLGVDGILKCDWNYGKTSSEAGALAKAVIFGAAATTGSGALTLSLYGKNDGELLWRFFKEMNEGVFQDANDTMERMMRKVGRNFPFELD